MSRFFPDPENAENLVKRFKEVHKKISSKKKDLLYLLSSHSSFIGRAVIKDPEILDLILASEFVGGKRNLKDFLEGTLEIARRSRSTQEFMSELRRYKYRELSRIIYRDIEDRGNFPEIMEELSDLASGVLEAAFRFFRKEIEREVNRGRFVVIGMGKFGGRELNLSSDIDLVYLYQGAEKPDVLFKLSERITKSLSAVTEDGFLYRVDL